MVKIFHKTVGYAVSVLREAKLSGKIKKKEPGDYFIALSPFFISQLANADKRKIDKFYGSINDSLAMRRFGAKNKKEFSYWAWRSCGIAALQMVLKTGLRGGFNKKTMDLVEEALEIGGYDKKNDFGWYHSALLKVAEKYGFSGRLVKFVPSSEIALLVDQNKYVLCSVKSGMGGHIVWVYGYRIAKGKIDGFWVNDPGTYYHEGEGRYISRKDFGVIFTRRLIVVENKDYGRN